MRQKLLNSQARADAAKAAREAKEREAWKARMQTLKEREMLKKQFTEQERKQQLQDWKHALEKGHSPTKWANYNKVIDRPPYYQGPGV